jgi:hypothetical protein
MIRYDERLYIDPEVSRRTKAPTCAISVVLCAGKKTGHFQRKYFPLVKPPHWGGIT